MEAPVCLRAQGIDDDDSVVDRVRRAWGLSKDDGGVNRGRGIYDVSVTKYEVDHKKIAYLD